MALCDENNTTAPSVGCGCRQCYRARELSVDPELIALARSLSFPHQLSPARGVIYRCLSLYLGGHVEWAALYPEIIKQLVKLSDEAFARELKIAQLTPLPMAIKGV